MYSVCHGDLLTKERFESCKRRPPQSAQSARLSWRHILKKCDFGGTFEDVRDRRL